MIADAVLGDALQRIVEDLHLALEPAVVLLEGRGRDHTVVGDGGAGVVHLQQEAGVDDGAVFGAQRPGQGDQEVLLGLVVLVLAVRDGAGGRGDGHEGLGRAGGLAGRLQVVDVALKLGMAHVFERGHAHGVGLGGLRPLAAVAAGFQLGVELAETLAIGAAGERIRAGGDRALLETAQAGERIERPAGRFAVFAVVDRIDAGLDLLAHHILDRLAQLALVGSRRGRVTLLRLLELFQQVGGPDQAADMGRQDALGAALHGFRLCADREISQPTRRLAASDARIKFFVGRIWDVDSWDVEWDVGLG